MNILQTDYTLKNKSLDIYVAGCNGNPHCTSCQNPESWDFKLGTEYDDKYFNYLEKRIKEFDLLIENIMIFGGEPLDQDEDELIQLLFDLEHCNKKIWIFTRYEINEISDNIKFFCDYIKTGRYEENLSCEDNVQYGIKLATSNQKIFNRQEFVKESN